MEDLLINIINHFSGSTLSFELYTPTVAIGSPKKELRITSASGVIGGDDIRTFLSLADSNGMRLLVGSTTIGDGDKGIQTPMIIIR